MSLYARDWEIAKDLSHMSELYATYGVHVNALSVDEIFALYERAGFLYPEKAARLLPHLDQVRDNWSRLLRAGTSLLYVLTAGDDRRGWASLAVWRTAREGWMSQHLVSENNPFASRAVMLAAAAASILRGVDESAQNWFRPENRFPARVFGSMVSTIGPTLSSVRRHSYFAVPKNISAPRQSTIRVVAYDSSYRRDIAAIAAAARGSVYVAAEELTGDIEFKAVDALYRQVGLSRTRQVWLAYRKHKDEPIGAILAHRGPLGINFSYLENRCDLLLHPTLPESEVADAVASLLQAASSTYDDFELDEIPVIADEMAGPILLDLGADFLRHYCQGIWLREGHPRFYRHVDSFYSKLLARAEKQEEEPSLVGSEWR
jgi:hypothetical protein